MARKPETKVQKVRAEHLTDLFRSWHKEPRLHTRPFPSPRPTVPTIPDVTNENAYKLLTDLFRLLIERLEVKELTALTTELRTRILEDL
jgi:uncharacterized protein YfkK (UPF0435 family)